MVGLTANEFRALQSEYKMHFFSSLRIPPVWTKMRHFPLKSITIDVRELLSSSSVWSLHRHLSRPLFLIARCPLVWLRPAPHTPLAKSLTPTLNQLLTPQYPRTPAPVTLLLHHLTAQIFSPQTLWFSGPSPFLLPLRHPLHVHPG